MFDTIFDNFDFYNRNEILVKLPGYSKDSVRVWVDGDGILNVTAENKELGKIKRSYIIDGVNSDMITANMKDGLLRIKLGEKEKKRKAIEVK